MDGSGGGVLHCDDLRIVSFDNLAGAIHPHLAPRVSTRYRLMVSSTQSGPMVDRRRTLLVPAPKHVRSHFPAVRGNREPGTVGGMKVSLDPMLNVHADDPKLPAGDAQRILARSIVGHEGEGRAALP